MKRNRFISGYRYPNLPCFGCCKMLRSNLQHFLFWLQERGVKSTAAKLWVETSVGPSFYYHVTHGGESDFCSRCVGRKGFPAPYTLIKECTHCPRYTSRTVDPGFVHVLQLASPSKVYLEALFLLCKSWYSPSGPWLIPGSNNPLLNPRPDPSFCLGSRSWFRISKTGIKVEVDFTNRFNSLHFHTEERKRWTKSWLVHWNEFLKLEAQNKNIQEFFLVMKLKSQ